MNILNLIQQKAKAYNSDSNGEGLDAVLSHFSRAADLLSEGQEKNENQYFNDVIYRTNQAYEGILKEAYRSLSGQEAGRMRLYDIENYFKDERILSGRVLDLFENYRRQWRNPSTHDYRLLFSDNEAFLAIVSVIAFAHALLDKMIEFKSFRDFDLPTSRSLDIEKIKLTENTFIETVRGQISDFFNQVDTNGLSRAQVLGILSAFLSQKLDNFTLKRDEKISENGTNRYYDLSLSVNGEPEALLLELAIGQSKEQIEGFFEIMRNDVQSKAYTGGFLVILGEPNQIMIA